MAALMNVAAVAAGAASAARTSVPHAGAPAAHRLGVVADDLTGATDIGSMSAKAGHLTHVHSHDGFTGGGAVPSVPVCVLDTDSRFDDPRTAYDKVHAATGVLADAGYQRFHKKTCSVFRGNVGAEFDAMLDALGEEFAVVVLGFPKNGRTTRDGVHHVNGVRLEDSAFRHDPVHPMTDSDLVAILGAQTGRRVSLATHELVAGGPAALAAVIGAARDSGGYLIVDVVDQAALTTIAAAVELAEVRVLCGASGLVEELARLWPAPHDPTAATRLDAPLGGAEGVLVIAGSLTPQTRDQVARVRKAGIETFTLDPLTVLSTEAAAARAIDALAAAAAGRVARGEPVLVHADHSPDAVQATQNAGLQRGLDRAATGRLVSTSLAKVAARCRESAGVRRLVVAGGDTSAAVCRALGIRGLRVLDEVAPGVPACLSLSRDAVAAVFKSGSFGGPEFLVEAVAHLQEVA